MPGRSEISIAADLFLVGPGGHGTLSDELAGSKAANLSRMAKLGLKVPPAFVLSTRLCQPLNANAANAEGMLRHLLSDGIDYLERATGKRFGNSRHPLFVSVRSGAARSMPGMMATILDIGLNADTVRGLIRSYGNPRLAWDCYRRFVQGYAEITAGAAPQAFAARINALMSAERVSNETELDPEALERLAQDYLGIAEKCLEKPIPSDPMQQLVAAVRAVFQSWESPRAREYRRLNALDDLLGTAVTVQAMVFGNAGGDSGSGVAFTRDPATGKKAIYADFIFDAQGEDIVSGRRVPGDITILRERMPHVADALEAGAAALEHEFQDMQDIEFTVEEGQLYFLQTRSGKRTPRAALTILIDLVNEGIISRAEGASRAKELDLEATAITRFSGNAGAAARGKAASAGVASGRVVFDSERAGEIAKLGDPIILVRPETSTEDIAGFALAAGILTALGGRTAHAAVVARQLGKVCVAGCSALAIDCEKRIATLAEREIKEGDWISINGETGEVFLGKREIIVDKLTAEIEEISRWLKSTKRNTAASNALNWKMKAR
jgi:pyruvate,orthophosphate dikinase